MGAEALSRIAYDDLIRGVDPAELVAAAVYPGGVLAVLARAVRPGRDDARVDEDAFWRLIEYCRPTGPDPACRRLAENLTKTLSDGPVFRVVGFAEQMSWALYRLDRKELGEGHSGDSFLYARAAAVAAGREAFESVLADPANFEPFSSDWGEALLYVPDYAYAHLTGEEWGRDTRYSYESYSNSHGWGSGS